MQHYFEMQDGVIHVYGNKDCKSKRFGCWTSFAYFNLQICVHLLGSLCMFTCSFAAKEELFPVADATAFFTDLHHILRVIAAGNIRTLCHHRLNLLEQVESFLLKTISD